MYRVRFTQQKITRKILATICESCEKLASQLAGQTCEAKFRRRNIEKRRDREGTAFNTNQHPCCNCVNFLHVIQYCQQLV